MTKLRQVNKIDIFKDLINTICLSNRSNI